MGEDVVLRLQIRAVGLKGKNIMRIPMLAVLAILTCAAAHAPAQTVIDVEGQKAASPQAQDQGQPQALDRTPAQAQESLRSGAQSRFSGPEDRAALETEIAQLQDEVASLRKLKAEVSRLRDEVASLREEIVALQDPPPPRPPADLSSPSGKGGDMTIKLPTHADIARARDFIEETWRRLVEMMVTMQKDMMRKG